MYVQVCVCVHVCVHVCMSVCVCVGLVLQHFLVGDNLHEMSKPIFWEKLEKYHQFVGC